MQGLTVSSLSEQSAVNDSSTLVLKVRVPCISKLNNEKIIIKDSSAPLKLDTIGLSNIYKSCANCLVLTGLGHINIVLDLWE